MPKPQILIGALSLFSLLVVSGCGGSSQTQPPPPPSLTFSNSSLSGSYVVAVNGVTSGKAFTLMTILQPDGNGTITSGHAFYNSSTNSFGNTNVVGTYSVTNNGLTVFNLNIELLGQITLDAVLLSNQHGLVVRFDTAATASGTLDQQDTSVFNAAAIAGTYVFNQRGTDSADLPEASVGTFTVDTSSNITGGVQDTNDNGTITSNAAIMSGPTSTLDVASAGQGVFSYTTAPEGLRDFALVVIDANHIKFASNLSTIIQAGDLFRVSPPNLSGSFVFTLQGVGLNGDVAFAAGGVISTDGAGNVLNSSIEDINDGGLVSLSSPLTGSYVVSGGRAAVTLNGGSINLAAYPSMGGIQVIELDSSVVATGMAIQQSGTLSNATLSGNYAAALSGDSTSSKFVGVAHAVADGAGHITGMLNFNNNGSLQSGLTLNGSYAISANGRAPGTLMTSAGSLNVVYYVAGSNGGVFIEVDGGSVSEGLLVQQQ